MKKEDLRERAKKVFETHPNADVVFMSEDNMPFLTERAANNHVCNKKIQVFVFNRDEVIVSKKVKTAKELVENNGATKENEE